MIVELYEAGVEDFEVFSQYDVFMMLYEQNEYLYCELIKFFLGDVNLHRAVNTVTGERVLYDKDKDIIFDLTSYMLLSSYIRAIHHISEDRSKMAKKSKALKQALIETGLANRDYLAQQHEKDKLSGKFDNYYQKLITKLCVTSRYNRDELLTMKLYEFYEIFNNIVGFYSWQFTLQKVAGGQYDNSKIKSSELNYFGN